MQRDEKFPDSLCCEVPTTARSDELQTFELRDGPQTHYGRRMNPVMYVFRHKDLIHQTLLSLEYKCVSQ